MKKTAIILGATGLTGSYLLDLLLMSEDYEKVKIFTRKTTGKKHPKLEEFIGDILYLEKFSNDFKADDVFCCIGTTKAQTPNKDEYYAIDYGIPVSTAKLCEQNQISTLSIISAIGSNPKSSVFYSRTKGEMEQSVLKYNIPNILIYRPSLIYGERKDKRLAENIATILINGLQFLFIGKMKKYRAITGKELANALFLGVKKTGHQIIERDQFLENKN
ncbi:NAD-dependent epimerase/dehydratase family protein [Flavobacterium columnare]|uniref:Nucleoside-diphosphate-sugar epimerase n=5 Tax=Flavobacterium columnare TaxID=996 RepID=G8X944_FLACA|nr:NAD-dependent epimerase/dehydratase family protein [Flavobacterium columnare]AEW85095.1 nucleoside-diphosphate-sugar epimerase [Flavobacterium columnare ATCC 49512]AMO19479.1 NAD-dependent epimerase/dehydratase family protein [Flavobacterium columnare]PTD15553.1 nucleoside-diphosphate sugar epimerase [Flavobacterium columnare]QOG56447.1 NAD-dependent epimerase/dehydratase family protein [Flavobacterium columnare]QOG59172.1 NAD-dependent epimerase/dehydratase family protein [Flavobacterium c